MPISADPNVLVGHAGADDAGVYRLSEDSALVLTVDFFTPIVDDPFDFGRAAAANSLSDIYAMGARPVAALNIAGFPEGSLPDQVLRDILRGGAQVALEAGVPIIGGHTVKDDEIKYGLSVVGMVDPRRLLTNAGAQVGDRLILTKPLGTGVLSTALKQEQLDDAGLRRLVDVMTTLNKRASEVMLEHDAHACTDITGYGLLGHGYEITRSSSVSFEVDAASVPLIDGVLDAVRAGYLTGGGASNRKFLGDDLDMGGSVDEDLQHVLFDPQTAGGLLIAVAPDQAEALVAGLRPECPQAAIIGACTAPADAAIIVR